ncbi:MAG TPA: hypothetical protein VLV30_03025 [Methanomicrobiales archaeon]|nr:hypothetical protein [Methanomicrobiales archaeon]
MKLARWIKYFLISDVVLYILLLLIFPNLWLNIGIILALIIIGTIVSYSIYEELLKYRDNNWIKLAEILGIINVSLNAFFCTIIGAAMITGLFIASGILVLHP